MSSTFTYPGVYVTEQASGAQAVPAAATSIAMFVGMADIGPFDVPTRVQSLNAFVRTFGETSSGEMADQVRQYFVNGGGDCYVMRIADGERQAEIRLLNEAGTAEVLRVLARDAGVAGDLIRVEVDYATATPELTFNITAYRSVNNADGTFGRAGAESHANLSMDPHHPRYVVGIVNTASTLIRVEDLATAPAAANVGGASVGGLFYNATAATALADLGAAIDADHNSFRVSVDGRAPVTVVLDPSAITPTNADAQIVAAIEAQYQGVSPLPAGSLTVQLNAGPGVLGRLLQIASREGAVLVTSAPTRDLATRLMLGSANGGVELDDYTLLRPGPSGLFARLGVLSGSARPGTGRLARLLALAEIPRNQLTGATLTDPGSSSSPYAGTVAIAGTPADPIGHRTVVAPFLTSALGSFDAVRDGIDAIGAAITDAVNATTPGRWIAQRQGLRLVLRPASGLGPAASLNVAVSTSATEIGTGAGYLSSGASTNLAAYTVGMAAGGGLQSGEQHGLDGDKPQLGDYNAAFAAIESNVEIFNMMVLPRAADQSNSDRRAIWGAASSFCAAQRAILFVDPPDSWTTIDNAEKGASGSNPDPVKAGVDARNSVIHWPRLVVPTAASPSGVTVDPSGSMAGLYARTDTRFGTWKAPAGLEATLTGVLGVEVPMSDPENGRINPKAVNAIRVFPSGVTSWGARTMVGSDDTGNVDDKYVNVRRTMLFIENSLYRGLRFAVFRSNNESLWSSIRLAAGSFMNGLMLQGAFASNTKSEAYYVRCDATTTTPTDINLGIVNVLVGFAPNKPAEFVHLVVTQMAGQVEA